MQFFVQWIKLIRHSDEFELTGPREQDALTRVNLGFIVSPCRPLDVPRRTKESRKRHTYSDRMT